MIGLNRLRIHPMEFFINFELGFIIPFQYWIESVFYGRRSDHFWFYLNGQPLCESLRRLLTRECFTSPTFHEFELEWYMEGNPESPTIQDFINYCAIVKTY
jgi:hypothetical protein